jgi:mycothiol synthase
MAAAEQPAQQQLHMIWPLSRPQGPLLYPVPGGYSLRAYRQGDAGAYIGLMRRAGFSQWDESKAQRVFDTMYPGGVYFVVRSAGGALVATAAAQDQPHHVHPAGGEMGWVAADPDHRGQGLSYVVVSLATRRLLAEGHQDVYLRTDDARLPAIRVYLNLGFVPFLYLPDMARRWQAVCAALDMPLAISS